MGSVFKKPKVPKPPKPIKPPEPPKIAEPPGTGAGADYRRKLAGLARSTIGTTPGGLNDTGDTAGKTLLGY